MSPLVFMVEFALLLVCFLAHIALWRGRCPRNHGMALIVIFSLPLALAFFSLPFFLKGLFLPSDVLSILLLHLSLGSAYILTYPAIEGLSLSLVCLHVLGNECAGLTAQKLLLHVDEASLRETKVRDLLNSGLVVQAEGSLRLTARGKCFVGPFVLFRRLLGLPPGQG